MADLAAKHQLKRYLKLKKTLLHNYFLANTLLKALNGTKQVSSQFVSIQSVNTKHSVIHAWNSIGVYAHVVLVCILNSQAI